jgi:hypothetical protein
MSMPRFFAVAIDLKSGLSPTCQELVPAESTIYLSFGSLDANIPSAKGDLQIFPKQTITILTGIVIYSFSIRLEKLEIN